MISSVRSAELAGRRGEKKRGKEKEGVGTFATACKPLTTPVIALRLAYALVPVQQREMVETARGGEGDLEWASEAGEEDAADVFGEARHGAEGNIGKRHGRRSKRHI